ncbi:MAG: hypothetical protein HYX48_00035 [Chlamydiales bacterium]|nr:hypothetical protein [Chlamydiales bacterium]
MSRKRGPLATVISFCTNDWRFLERSIQEARLFSDLIMIVICDHFFDGSLEDLALIEECYRRYPDCSFIEFAFDPEKPYGRSSPFAHEDLDRVHHWHNTTRLLPFYLLPKEIESILFLDADEIVDGKRFAAWIKDFPFEEYSALRLATYWYSRSPYTCASIFPDSTMLAKRRALTPDLLLHDDERIGTFLRTPGPKQKGVVAKDGLPLVHHYSWVRTKEELFKKTETWGHHWERDWKSLIEKAESEKHIEKEFVRGYEIVETSLFFDPLSLKPPALPQITLETHIRNLSDFPHVRRVTSQEIFRLDLLLHCQ